MAQSQRKGKGAKGGGNRAFYGVLGVIVVAGIAVIAYAITGSNGSAATELVEIDAPNVRALYDQAVPVRMGPEDAPVKVVEFGDFQCPACGQFSLGVRPTIVEQYVNTGKVQFVFYDFPLVSIHDHSFLAARATRCAGDQPAPGTSDGGQTAYWVYHDKVYQEQSNWAYEQGSVIGDFVDYARDIGLDAQAFETCLKSDRFADVVSANRRLGEQLRISSTPTILINNRRVSDWSVVGLSQAIEQALGSANGSP